MKKVISALTAAAICASMTASVMSASALYATGDMGLNLKVVSAGNGTISEDGKTVTFATAADAAGAELILQDYFMVSDVANPSVQQVGICYAASAGVTVNAGVGKDENDLITGSLFVSTFSYQNKLKKVVSGAGSVAWGAPAENFGFDAPYDSMNKMQYQWASDFADSSRDNYKETAAFYGETSDAYPLNQFTATLGDLADGTYEITYAPSYVHPEHGDTLGNWVNVDGKSMVEIGTLSGIKIVVGDATATTPTEDTTTAPTEATTTESTPTPTNPTPGGDHNYDTFTWYIPDVYFDPETDDFAMIDIKVQNDPGNFGYTIQLLMDGGVSTAAGWEVGAIEQGDAYNWNTFQPNVELGYVGCTFSGGPDDIPTNQVAADGATVVSFGVLPMDTADLTPGTVYQLTIADDYVISNVDGDNLKPNIVGGRLIIGKEGTEPDTTESTPTTSDETPTTGDPNPTPSQGDGDYLYGDVNENGKVELVDVVMLNRALTGYADQQLTERAIVNANCYRNGESDAETTRANLDGHDSIEILKYLIEVVTSLPTQG